MSTYVDTAINPKTGKSQKALFVDDYYGSHQYGVAFRNDGTDAELIDNITPEKYVVYPRNSVELSLKSTDSSSDLPEIPSNTQD